MDRPGVDVIRIEVELSGEAPALGRAEAIAAAETLGGRAGGPPEDGPLTAVELPSVEDAARLADRLALARRCLRPIGPLAHAPARFRSLPPGSTAAVRRLGRPTSGGQDEEVRRIGRAIVDAGGRIDLERPEHRFWIRPGADPSLYEECGSVDRSTPAGRRMPTLPFQRPVSLPPRLARAAANLARIRAGDRVADPFVGTGALLAEAGLLGARLYGVDRDPEMVRGALRNLAHLAVGAEEMIVGDAGTVALPSGETGFDAVLTDPPYGRSSSTGGEDGSALLARVLPRWAEAVRPGGKVVVILGAESDPLGGAWRRELAVPVRVHRSLTRRFCVYGRAGDATPTPG